MKHELHVGQAFYDLTVIDASPIRKGERVYVTCLCSCGTIKVIRKDGLFDSRENRRIKSCGCKRNHNRATKTRKPDSMYSALYNTCKVQAKHRNIEFDLLKEEHSGIVKQDCHYCGSPPTLGQVNGKNGKKIGVPVPYNGIDRIDSTIGYINENCVPCCEMCNKMKMGSTVEDFMRKVLEIHNHHNQIA